MTITFRWDDFDNDGFVDGTNPPMNEIGIRVIKDGVVIANCVENPQCDAASNAISVQVTSLSTFVLAGAPALSLFDITKAEVKWEKGRIKLSGKIALPLGRTPFDVNAKGSAAVDLSTLGTVLNQAVVFLVKGGGMKWEYEAPEGTLGIESFKIDWGGAKFDYSQAGMRIKSHHIGQNATTLEINRAAVPGAFSVAVNGVIISVDEAGAVTASSQDVRIEVDEDGEIEAKLPFALLPSMTMKLSGAVNVTINVADHYTAAVGNFRIEAGFAATAVNPGALTPTLSLRVTLGAEGFPGAFTIGASDWKDVKPGEWKYKKE